jgi:hypothetical protein
MHKHVYASTYYLMNNILPYFIKYVDNPLITFQNDSVQLLYLNKNNFNHNLQIFFCTFAFKKQLELSFIF